MKMFAVTLVFLGVFCINAFADDQAERQEILEYTILNSPACSGVIVHVPESIIQKDGQVDAAAAMVASKNIDQQAKIKNCFGQVNNAIVNYNSTKKNQPFFSWRPDSCSG